MHQVHRGQALEQFRCEVRWRGIAGRSVVEGAGLFLRQSDQLRERGRRHRGVDRNQQRPARHQAHRRERLARVITQLAIQAGRHRQGAGAAIKQRVAVSRGLRHGFGTHRATRAGAVLDHELLAQGFAEFGGDQSTHHVGRAAGREWHDDFYRPGRVGLGENDRGCNRAEYDQHPPRENSGHQTDSAILGCRCNC